MLNVMSHFFWQNIGRWPPFFCTTSRLKTKSRACGSMLSSNYNVTHPYTPPLRTKTLCVKRAAVKEPKRHMRLVSRGTATPGRYMMKRNYVYPVSIKMHPHIVYAT